MEGCRQGYRRILRQAGVNPFQFMFVRKDYDSLTFLHLPTNKLLVIRR